MIGSKPERVLLVASNIFSIQLTGKVLVKYVNSIDRVFPAIYEMAPNIIVFDYDYLNEDMEIILRRIRTNAYYNKIKICCFKSCPNCKIDSFLKILGVNHVVYKSELQTHPKTALNSIKSIFNSAVVNLFANASV